MANRRDKQFRQIKRSHTLAWLIMFIVIILFLGMLTGVFISVFSTAIVSDKFKSGRSEALSMARVYETCIREGADPGEYMKTFGMDYIITDSEHNVIASGGENTCSFESAELENRIGLLLRMYIVTGGVNAYPDTSVPVFFSVDNDEDNGGEIVINIVTIIANSDKFITGHRSIEELDMNGELSYDTGMASIPIWLGVNMSDGREFIAKAYITVDIGDVGIILMLMASISVFLLVIFTMIIVNFISGIVRHGRTLKVFFTDAVTQGKNAMYFLYKGDELIKKLLNHSTSYAVVDLNFVGYRNFCVCHSVAEGERILGRINAGLEARMTKKKEICTRFGEADFALLLRADGAQTVASRVRELIDAVANVDPDHTFTFHAGVAMIHPDGTPGMDGELIRRRNTDIGEAYNNACTARETLMDTDGSGVAFFNDTLVADRKWVDAVQERQRSAVDNEEFVVYYQPKYDPRTDELLGAEALIRWQSPDLGFVPPGRMIPIFEKNGFITEIDHYMIKHVARDQKRWLDAGCRCVPVSVNVSRSHFIESDLAEQIRDTVDAEGCPHEYIEIELTESAFFDDKKAMINTIGKLKSYGFAVSMDDFGSGYSSLNSLKDMPLDVLKLDAEFFRGENGGGRGEIVVSEAIKLAKSLNMRTVAEGVEIREQVDFLASQGCDMIQGYFYAKPMPGSDYESRMKERYKPKGE
ncbi:MAG: bifunctional diguanylate cyclase/phosphodiesterase [Ruminiclostridium sp.]|nr:bifunctional diguanylate cyclase/phosphodiesterase [Ruminiclostridium sp.]